jgi:predicted nucleotidyltransferase component of viral defense system
MQGLAEKTNIIFEALSKLNCIKGYTLIGGTALSLQINKRLSEDMDFCKWSTNLKSDKPTVDWPTIEKELKTIGTIDSRDILGFDHVNFIVSGVKISFLTKQENTNPVKTMIPILNNIKAADLDSLGAMKVEVMLRRSVWRDYYDIYSLLKEGKSLKEMIDGASIYSNRRLKTRDALNFLSNSNNYKKEKDFRLLKPVYDVDGKTIEELVKSIIKKEYIIDSKTIEQTKGKSNKKGLSM